MHLNILFSAGDSDWPLYQPQLATALTARGIEASLLTETARPESIDFIIYSPASQLQDFAPFTQVKAILSLWAGVERIVGNPTIRVPLCRMVDSGITEGMTEWVTAQVLRHHLGLDAAILGQDGVWRNHRVPPLARDRHVGILGIGALGQSCAAALRNLNFQVAGWNRNARQINGIACYSGDDGLAELLSWSDILVCLLPNTPQTDNLLNAARLADMRRGAVLINAGRGNLIDDNALLAALDSGQLSQATLDVFRQEPLPKEHPFWTNAKVTVSPHVAAATRPDTAALAIAENIARWRDGQPFLNVVDRAAGY
jgi:glyoxylate/hydroxypyruvate reductase